MIKAARYCKCLCISIPLALVALAFFCILPGPPVMAAPVLNLGPSSGPVGTSVTITGTVFSSYEGDSIHILFDTTEIQTITIPSTGSFSITWSIPADAASGPHVIGAKRETTDSSFFISAPFSVDTRQLTLSVNEGITGTEVNIAGIGFYINEPVTISYNNTSAGTIGSVTASSSGKFSRFYTIPAGTGGIHKFTAVNNRGNTAEAGFKIIPNLKLNVDSGAPGEVINVRGSGFGMHASVSLSLDTVNVATVPADDYGSIETQFTIPPMTLSTYYLKAQDNLGNKTEVLFPVTAGAILSESTGAIGSPVTVHGNGFQSGSSISVTYDNKPVAAAIADNNGKFTVTFNIPSSESGAHVINVTDGVTTRHYSYAVEAVPPPPPSPLSPARKSIAGAFTTLNWQPVTDPSVPVTYSLDISTDQNFSTIVLHKDTISGTQYILTSGEALAAEPPVTTYYWRVMAIDGAGNRGGWSEVWSYFVGVPPTPILSLPEESAIVTFPVGLNWSSVTSLSGPVAYQLQVSRNPEFSQLLIDEKNIKSSVYTIPLESRRIFNKKIPYYWRVRAEDNARNIGNWSNPGSFNILSTGFPAWATYTLIGLAAVILALLAFRYGRRTAYH
jgi:hypothetical protein